MNFNWLFIDNLGGPSSGKRLYCEKLVQEFGYTYISTGDLMRIEMKTVSNQAQCFSNKSFFP